jgi:hypothetical protein
MAIDIASGFAGAELHTSERNPIARHNSSLVHRVASELAASRLEAQRRDR